VCGKMIVEEQYESSRHSANLKTPPLCFKYYYIFQGEDSSTIWESGTPQTTGPRNLALPTLLLHASAARVESKNLEIRLGPSVWENDRGGAIRVLQAFRQPKNSSTCFKYKLLYIPRILSLLGIQGDVSLAWSHNAGSAPGPEGVKARSLHWKRVKR